MVFLAPNAEVTMGVKNKQQITVEIDISIKERVPETGIKMIYSQLIDGWLMED